MEETLPSGYKRLWSQSGVDVNALGRHTKQEAHMYTQGGAREDIDNAIILYSIPVPADELFATAGGPSEITAIGDTNAVGTYHDGWWELGRGDLERPVAGGHYVHWSPRVHSITVASQGWVHAVRAPAYQVSKEDMERLLASVLGLPR